MAKVPYGKIPGKEFVSGGDNPFAGTKLGIITRVDELHMKADVKMITGSEERFELDLTQAMAGPRSFLGGIPEKNSLVIIAYRRRQKQIYDAVIVGYLPTGNLVGLKFDPFSPVEPGSVTADEASGVAKLYGKTIRFKRIIGRSGDVMGMSASGAEMHLSRDVKFCNRAGDLFELRDVDRTFVSQSIHRIESDSAAYLFSGAARRGGMNLPLDIFQKEKGVPGRTVKTADQRYFGREELIAAGLPPTTFINKDTGKVLDRINADEEFPPLTYSNGRQVFFPSDSAAVNFEDVEKGGSLRAFTERRLEIRHDTDLQQEVLDEIDGFSVDRPRVYIEQVFGTVIGNDPFSSLGQRQYGRILKPKIFEDFDQLAAPSGFRMEEAMRPPSVSVDEALTMAGAYLFRMKPPRSASKNDFAVAVTKQGKLLVNIPGSSIENYPTSNVSAEVNMEGALKMRLGAATPDKISLHLTLEGGVFLDIGANADGECFNTSFHGAVKNTFKGGNSVDDVAHSVDVQGNSEKTIAGNDNQVVNGAYVKKVDGGYALQANKINLTGLSGFSGTFGEYNMLVSGKTQNQYALLYMETVVAGGKVSTILAGADIHNIVAGAMTYNVLAGATAFNAPAGAYAITVGTGAISITTAAGAIALSTAAGALSLGAAAGAVAITAGLAIALTSPLVVSIIAPQVLLGGPPAVLGVSRGLPMLPPLTPSLDWITGLPLQGGAMVRSI